MYSYRNEGGLECKFKCNLEDKIIAKDFNLTIRIGKVIALDDDGYVTIETPSGEVRTHNDFIICVANDYPKCQHVLGRSWDREVPFFPNTNWDNNKFYNNDGHDDWFVGDFTEGKLWMNNNEGYVVLVQPSGICLFDYI